MKRDLPFGNGSGKTDVDVLPVADDWIILTPKKPEPYPADLPTGLVKVLAMWFRSEKGVRIRTTLPIVKDGNLIGINVWFDRIE